MPRYEHGEDFPSTLNELSRVYRNRPMSSTDPYEMLIDLDEAGTYHPPPRQRGVRPGLANQGKAPLKCMLKDDTGTIEKPEETEQRQQAQARSKRLILPKTAKEKKGHQDLFLRRLDAHREAETTLVAPIGPAEDSDDYIARVIAIKQAAQGARAPSRFFFGRCARAPL